MCQVSCPVKSAQLNGKANLRITPKTDSITAWLRPLGVWFKGPVHPKLNERISLTQQTKRFYFSLNVPEIIFQKVFTSTRRKARRYKRENLDVTKDASPAAQTQHLLDDNAHGRAFTAVHLQPHCAVSDSGAAVAQEPTSSAGAGPIRSWLSLFIFVRGERIGRRCSRVRTRKCDLIYFFPLLLLHPQCPHDSSASSTTSTESSDKWNYQPFDIQLSSSGKIFFRRWRRRRRGLRIQDSRLCFQPFGDGSFVLRAPDWSNLKQR